MREDAMKRQRTIRDAGRRRWESQRFRPLVASALHHRLTYDCVLCCISDRYFRERLEDAGVRPVLLTTQLMYPGSFILHDALDPWLTGKDRKALRTAAGAAYARNQKIKTAAATGVFAELAP